MSIFLCAKCDNIRDADDGCEEAPASKYPRFSLICSDCMDEDYESAEADYAMHGADMSYDGIKSKLLAMGCPDDIAHELAREKSRG